jgi:predicted porin
LQGQTRPDERTTSNPSGIHHNRGDIMNIRTSSARPYIAAATASAFLPGAALHAAAQGVTLYGVADAAVIAQKSGAPNTGTVTTVGSGVNGGSRWGLRGEESLGDGLKAVFQLEQGFDIDTGAASSYSGNPSTATPASPNGTPGTGFNRRAYAGLETRIGTLTLGRDYTPFYFSALGADIFRLGMFGNLQTTVAPAGGSERFARVSNAIFYLSPDLHGLRLRAVYSLGSESAGGPGQLPRGTNRFAGLGAEYTHGDLYLTASYQTLEFPVVAGTPAAFTGATQHRDDGLAGVKYDFGSFALAAGYWRMGAPQSVSDAWLGASVKLGPGTVLAQVQRFRQDNPAGAERKGTALGLAYTYPLSKRTTLYASYGRTTNNATGSFGVASSGMTLAAGAVGADPSALAVGMRHNF